MSEEMKEWEESVVKVQPANNQQSIVPQDKPGAIDEIVEALASSGITDAIGYNVLDSTPYVRGVLPWVGEYEVRPWSNADDSHLLAHLQTRFGIKNERNVRHAFAIACDSNRFNPVEEAFDALPEWDGVERAGHLLSWFLGAEDSEYTQEVERLLFAGAIMRTFHPGAKFDYMPVLIGEQGCGKSTFARMFALHDEFFTDSLRGIGSKEGAELVQGNLVVEIAELDAIKGKDLETIKAFISRQSDDYRVPYQTRSEKHPRRCVLIGTTNTAHFLKDPSGNRRFLPITCSVQKPALSLFDENARAYFEQAWAEMLHLYRQEGSLSLVLSASALADAKVAQEEASVDDPWIGMIGEWLDGRGPHENVCVSQICEQALDIPRSSQQQWQRSKVRDILERHYPEWKRMEKKQRVQGGYGTQLAYRRE